MTEQEEFEFRLRLEREKSTKPRQKTSELFAQGRANELIPGHVDQQNPQETPTTSRDVFDMVTEPAATIATAIPAAVVGGVAGFGREVLTGDFGRGTGQRTAREVQEALTYQPRNPKAKQTLRKIGGALDASKLAGLPVMGGELPMIGRAVAQQRPAMSAIPGMIAQTPEASIVGRAGSVATKAGTAAQEATGVLTGVGAESYKQAFKAGKEGNKTFLTNMRGEAPVEQVLAEAQQGLANIQQANSAAYRTAKTGWAADKTPLKFDAIDDAFNRLEATTRHGDKSLVSAAERTKIEEVRGALDEWRADPSAHNTVGLDALKRRIDAIYPDSPKQAQAQRVITGTRNAVKDAIVKQAPDYAEAMAAYESQMGLINDIRKALSLGDKVSKDTAIRKLQSLTRNNVNTNYGYRQQLAEQLAEHGGADVLPAVAGQSLNAWMPRGLARLHAGLGAGAATVASPIAFALPFTSPRLMGEVFYGAGRLSGKFAPKGKPRSTLADLAIEEGPIPQSGGFAPKPYQERGLLSLADEPYQRPTDPKQLLRSRHDVDTIDFPLRQEVLQQPEISSAIDAFRAEAAQLQKVIDNAISPKVKASAQAKLEALQNEFAAGMKQLGVENAADAHGANRRLYEVGRTQLPIERTFDPRRK